MTTTPPEEDIVEITEVKHDGHSVWVVSGLCPPRRISTQPTELSACGFVHEMCDGYRPAWEVLEEDI